jgi:hypothetical protein
MDLGQRNILISVRIIKKFHIKYFYRSDMRNRCFNWAIFRTKRRDSSNP